MRVPRTPPEHVRGHSPTRFPRPRALAAGPLGPSGSSPRSLGPAVCTCVMLALLSLFGHCPFSPGQGTTRAGPPASWSLLAGGPLAPHPPCFSGAGALAWGPQCSCCRLAGLGPLHPSPAPTILSSFRTLPGASSLLKVRLTLAAESLAERGQGSAGLSGSSPWSETDQEPKLGLLAQAPQVKRGTHLAEGSSCAVVFPEGGCAAYNILNEQARGR